MKLEKSKSPQKLKHDGINFLNSLEDNVKELSQRVEQKELENKQKKIKDLEDSFRIFIIEQ